MSECNVVIDAKVREKRPKYIGNSSVLKLESEPSECSLKLLSDPLSKLNSENSYRRLLVSDK